MLYHVDLRSGLISLFSPAEADDDAILELAELLDHGGGHLPALPDWLVMVERPTMGQALVDGAASYRLGRHGEAPLVFAYCCWLDRYSEVCWMIVNSMAAKHGLPACEGPPAVPWVAAIRTPPDGLPAAVVESVCALESSIAWALIQPWQRDDSNP